MSKWALTCPSQSQRSNVKASTYSPVLPEVGSPWKAGAPPSSFPFLLPHHPLRPEFWMVKKLRPFHWEFFYTLYFFNVRKWEIKFKIKRQSVAFWKKWNPSLHPRHPLPPEFLMVEILRSLTAKNVNLFSISFQCSIVQKIWEIKRH